MPVMTSVYNDKRKRIEDLPDTRLGHRVIKVSDVYGQGLVVYDADRQDGVAPGRVRLWGERSNTESEVIEENCNFERPDTVADASLAVRGFAAFLLHGPSELVDAPLGETPMRYVDTTPEDDRDQYDEYDSDWDVDLDGPRRNTQEYLQAEDRDED